jgi:negative regulator of flagellin synthesis FlgM
MYALKGRWGIMNVTVNNVHRAYGTFNTDYAKSVNRVERAAEKNDSVEISDNSKEFSTILRAVMDTPDLRGDKVADIKSRVALGHYNVSSSAVANKILGDYYKNHE